MNVIKNDQHDNSFSEFQEIDGENESVFQFYGGISWKQIEYISLYQYGYTPVAPVGVVGGNYGESLFI